MPKLSDPPLRLTQLSVQFHTTGESKDKATRYGAQVVLNNHDVGRMFVTGDHSPQFPCFFDYGPVDLQLYEHPTMQELDFAILRVIAEANGTDLWCFEVGLTATFQDGQNPQPVERKWWFLNGSLKSENSGTVWQDFPLGQCHRNEAAAGK